MDETLTGGTFGRKPEPKKPNEDSERPTLSLPGLLPVEKPVDTPTEPPAEASTQTLPGLRPPVDPKDKEPETLTLPGGEAQGLIGRGEKQVWEPGDIVEGKYEVLSIAGRGGMGVVYKVRHREWQIDMAVKTPLPELVKNEASTQRFLREAQTWVDLGLHPNIVQCWYARELGGLPRLFADFMPGGSLKSWTMQGKLRPGMWPEILDMVIQACDGLGYAHERGVVHRDVKPGNLLMSADGRLCVTDFGLVKVDNEEDIIGGGSSLPANYDSGGDHSLTLTGSNMGTPEYGAPEQWGQARHVDARADIYALGIVFFELCVGRRPFDDGSHSEPAQVLIGRHLTTAPPDPRAFRTDVPEEVAQAVLWCLNKQPENRPQNMTVLRESLAGIWSQLTGKSYEREAPKAAEARGDALNNRAVSLWDLGRPREASAAWQQALELDPRHPEALFNKSLLEWRGQSGEPITDQEADQRLRDAKSAHPRAGLYLGYLHLERLAMDDAEEELTQALGDPELSQDGAAWRALGHSRMAHEKFAEAQVSYQRALALMPGDRISTECLALAQSRTRLRQSTALFQRRGATRVIKERVGSVLSLALAPDGKQVICGGGDGTVTLWEFPEGKYIRTLNTQRAEISAVATLPDGKHFLTGGGEAELKLWRLPDGSAEEDFFGKGHLGSIMSLAITPDGKHAVTGSLDKSLRVWELAKGGMLRTLRGHDGGIEAVVLSLDGKVAISGAKDGTLRFWDLASGLCVRMATCGKRIRALARSHDGQHVLAGGADGLLHLYRYADGTLERVFRGHLGLVQTVAFLPGGRYALSGGEDHALRMWETATGRCLRTFRGHMGPVQAMVVALDGRTVLSGGLENLGHPLRFWEMGVENLSAVPDETGMVAAAPWTELVAAPLMVCRVKSQAQAQGAQHQFKERMEAARTAYSNALYVDALKQVRAARGVAGYERDPDALSLITRLSPQILPRSGLAGGYLRREFDAHAHSVSVLAASPAGKWAVSAGRGENSFRLWDIAAGQRANIYEGHSREVLALAITPDGRHCFSGGADDVVRQWDLAPGGMCMKILTGHKGEVRAIAASPDKRTIVSGSSDGTMRQWDVATGKCLRVFQEHGDPIWCVAFAPDSRFVVSGSREGPLGLWACSSGKRLKDFSGHIGIVNALAVTPDGRLIISVGEDKTMRVWNLNTGMCLHTVRVIQGQPAAVVVMPDGRMVFTAGTEGPGSLVRLWETASGRALSTLAPHPKGITSAVMTEDGALLTGGEEGKLRLWQLDWNLAETEAPKDATIRITGKVPLRPSGKDSGKRNP